MELALRSACVNCGILRSAHMDIAERSDRLERYHLDEFDLEVTILFRASPYGRTFKSKLFDGSCVQIDLQFALL